MIPRTYPSSVDPVSGETQMVIYKLSSVSGLTRWVDYIPVRYTSDESVGGSYGSSIYMNSELIAGAKAWVDYIPVWEDPSASDAWQVSNTGYIPYGSPSLVAALSAIRRNGGTALYVPDDYGLVLGPELVPGSLAPLTATEYRDPAMILVVGKRYRVSATVTKTSGTSIDIGVTNGAYGWQSGNPATTVANSTELKTFSFTASDTVGRFTAIFTSAAGSVSNYSVREILTATSFIDSTGTQPVTAINDLVGLLTDRSYGAGNLGPELVTNGDFSAGTTGWNAAANASISNVGGALRSTSTISGVGARLVNQTLTGLVVGNTYRVTASVGSFGGAGAQGSNPQIQVRNLADTTTVASIVALALTNTTITGIFVATETSQRLRPRWDGNASTDATSYLDFDNISVREVLGNHATQPTTASKPQVTRVPKRLGPNLVVNGAGDSTAGWFLQDGALSTSGGEFVITANGGLYTNANQPVSVTVGRSYQVTTKIRRGTSNYASLQLENGGSYPEFGNAGTTTGVQTLVVVAATSTFSVRIWLAQQANGATAFFDDVEVREVLEWSNALDFDGGNDLLSLSSGAILQQGSDHWVTAAFVLDAVGATQAIFACHSTSSTVPVAAAIYISTGGLLGGYWRDDSNSARNINTATALQAGVPYVATIAKVGADYRLWLNGSLAGTVTGALGTTTLNNATIGAEVDTTTKNYLNGKLIDIALGQSTLTEADRKTIERNMAQRCGAAYVG